MRRFPFLVSRHVLAILLAVNLALLGTSIYLGLKSAGQMREIVKEDFNQQQLVLARHTAGLLEQDLNFLKRELSTLNFSPSIQYLEPLTWANRMRATLASVREEGLVEILRLDAAGQRAHLVDGRGLEHITTGAFQDAPYLEWAANPENKGQVYVSPVSSQVPNFVGRLITVMAVPTYEVSVDDSHPHPSGDLCRSPGLLYRRPTTGQQVHPGDQKRQDRLCLDHGQPGHLSDPPGAGLYRQECLHRAQGPDAGHLLRRHQSNSAGKDADGQGRLGHLYLRLASAA